MQVGRKNPKPDRFSSALALSELSDVCLTVMVPVTHQVQVGRKNPKPGRFSSALALSELRQNSSRWWASYNDGACQQILCEFCPQRKETKLLPKKSSKHNVLNVPAAFKPKYRKFCQISFQFKILDVSDTCRLDEGSLLFLSRQLMTRKFSPTSPRPCIAKDCSKDGCGEVGEDSPY